MRRHDGYRDRTEAGEVLAAALAEVLGDGLGKVLGDGLGGPGEEVVLALPRGGVPVAVPIARRFAAPLSLMIVRKLGVPGRPELAMGALARIGGHTELVRHEWVIADAGIDEASFQQVRRQEEAQLAARVGRYGERSVLLADRTVVLVDDGLATGMTALAAVAAARSLRPAQVVLAVPVGSRQAVDALSRAADQVVCPLVPRSFAAVSTWYDDFDQLTDSEVTAALASFHS